MANEIKKTVKDVGDAIKEGVHRGNADAEHDTRTAFGDTMTPGEKTESVIREGKEDVKAGIDRAKRNIRDAT
jgi:gas vesicle protein